MRKIILLLASILVIILQFEILPLPRFALRLGDKCVDCHYNPTGGIIRNENGFFYGQNLLSMISPREKDYSMSPNINENISVGLDFRGQFFIFSRKKSY